MNALTVQYYGQFPYVQGISDDRAVFSTNDRITGLKSNVQPENPGGCQKKMIFIFDHLIFASNPAHAQKGV